MSLEIVSTQKYRNTGIPKKVFEEGIWLYLIYAPVGYDAITSHNRADATTLKAFIEGKLHADNPLQRWHKVGRIVGVDDKSETASEYTFPNGEKIIIDRSHPAFDIQFHEGGHYAHTARQSFNFEQENYRIYIVDVNNVLIGTENEDDSTEMAGLEPNCIYEHDYKAATAKEPAMFKSFISLNAEELNENKFVHSLGFKFSKLKGVRDVILEDVSTEYTLTAGQHAVRLWDGGKTLNLVEEIGAACATATNFIFVRKSNSNTVTKTAALSSDGKAVILSASLADTDYADGQDMSISLAAVSVLSGNGLKYFEGRNTLTVVADNP